jgi:hypothetical protein
MIPYYGDFPVNATVYIPINTFDSNDPAASVTVTNLLNTDVHIHKDGGTTQRNNAAGITMSIDYDSITGNHLLTIDTSDNTVADFYQAGHEYQVRIEGATVDAGTINAWVGSFSLERSGGALALLKNATYGLSALESLVDDIGAAGAGLTAIPWNSAWDAEVQSECTDALNAYDPPTKAELDTAQGAVTLANGAHGGAATVITLQTPIVANTTLIEGGDATDALTAAVPTAAGIADAVWDELTADHAGVGSTGAALSAAGGSGDPWATALPGAYGAGTAGKIIGDNVNAPIATVDTVVDAIKAKTDSLTFTVAGDVDCNVQTWKGAAAQDMTGDAFARLGAPAGASVSADVAAVKSDTGAILTDTGTTLDGKIDTIDGIVDSILADTGTDGVVVAAGSKTGYSIGVGGIAASAFAANALDAAALAADAGTEIANAIKAIVVEAQGSYTLQQALSIILSVLAGVTADNGATLKTPNGVANRVAATIDANANRTAMTLTPSA